MLVKGIVTGEDAALAVEHGVVSNHGGRNEETLRATVDCLPEVVAAVRPGARRKLPSFMAGQLADQRSDLAPRFASDDRLTAFNLARLEIKVR
jgi:hypothetical protein